VPAFAEHNVHQRQMNFDDTVNNSLPVEQNFNFIVLILKAARVARLIPSTKVVALSEKINLYWYMKRMTPRFWWNSYRKLKERVRRMKENNEDSKGRKLMRRSSWGGIEIAAMAALKLEEEKRMKESRNFWYKIRTWGRHGLRYVGIRRNSNEELHRHIAAAKIQRAWRNRLATPAVDTRSDDGLIGSAEGSHAWNSRDSISSSVTKKRSMLSRNGFSNKTLGRILENPIMGRSPQQNPKANETDLFSGQHKLSTKVDHSQVGTAMAEVTGQRVGIFILLSLVFVFLFTYYEVDSTIPSTMVVLHGQVIRTTRQSAARKAVETARRSAIPKLYSYASNSTFYGTSLAIVYNVSEYNIESLREREKMKVVVNNTFGISEGYFVVRQEMVQSTQVEIIATIFVLLIWFFGVASFAGPIMTFVILPIERMVRLLGMLMIDPLGYQSNSRFKNFLLEEDVIVKNSQWTREVLKGMETSFLMSTILRIGSLMKVGFGSAGVEIIRNNLQKGQSTNELILNSKGSTVSCIFLFCDIRQFTDATECLQEEVFVFTNRIAAVVHSICHSYGGSANKNVGDAFLVSWLLEDDGCGALSRFSSKNSATYVAKHHQADKALLSVVKICIALHHDKYYVETMSNHPRTALLNKLRKRPGPIVQMGFGLHAGKAVQGAIGSQRKIDATYVSEAVERAEYLESSTKKYTLKMLMSDNFHRLLHSSNRRRCRMIDKIMFRCEDTNEYEEEAYGHEGDIMELYTYDMDVDALWKDTRTRGDVEDCPPEADDSSSRRSGGPSITRSSGNSLLKRTRRISMRNFDAKNLNNGDEFQSGSLLLSENQTTPVAAAAADTDACKSINSGSDHASNIPAHYHEGECSEDHQAKGKEPELVLPSGPSLYSANVWLQPDMRRVRRRYTPVVMHSYSAGLKKYYAKDWDGARRCFEAVIERFEDGPSLYFINEMKKYDYVPPPLFQPYGGA
jgi:class 3 adenylate cyclase